MHPLLQNNLFLVKEHVGIFKAANNFDIYDPQSGRIIMECREDNLGLFTKFLRFTDFKTMTPFDIQIRTPAGEAILNVHRGVSFILSKVRVSDGAGMPLGGFNQKFFSIGGKFDVIDQMEQPLCSLEGNWVGWNFKFIRNGSQLAEVTKKWAGLGKEMFTSADNYVLKIEDSVPTSDPARPLILGSVMCIDMVLKEKK